MSDFGLIYCVGATKAGTTRLYAALHDHPDCVTRMVKEAHYWDTFDAGQRSRQIAAYQIQVEDMRDRISRLQDEGRPFRAAKLAQRMGEMIDLIGVLDGNRKNDQAYLDWLTQDAGDRRVAADFTPAYALLGDATYKRMLGLSPLTKVVFLLRDPLSRLWSHVRMHAGRYSKDSQELATRANNTLSRILNNNEESHIVERGDYESIIVKLRRVVPDGQLFIGFAETVFGAEGWAQLCRFFGLPATGFDEDRRAYEGTPAQMRDALVPQAVTFLRNQYDWVARNVGPLPREWQASLALAKG